VRRHQSLTYGAAAGAGGGVRHQLSSSGLKRSGTLQVTGGKRQTQQHTPSPPNEQEDYEYEEESLAYDDDYSRSPPVQQQQQVQGQYSASQIGRQSPWNNTGNDWRGSLVGTGFSNVGNNAAVDDVQRALSALEIASNNYQSNNNQNNNNINFQGGQSAHPPRFNPNHPPPAHAPGMRTPNGGNGSNNGGGNGGGSRNLQLVTDFDGRKTPLGQGNHPSSASAYVPPIGNQHSHQQDDGTGFWEQNFGGLPTRTSNPNLNFGYQQGKTGAGASGIPRVPSIPSQYLNQQQQHTGAGGGPRLGVSTSLAQGQGVAVQPSQPGFISTPIDVPSLIAAKGYNPTNFDVRPSFVSCFDFCHFLFSFV
jgi:YTH domain-containing family protein